MACPECKLGNNIYATVCQHCGASLKPAPKPGPLDHAVREPCQRCSHAEFLAVTPVSIPAPQSSLRVRPLTVICAEEADGERVTAGSFHAYVCLGCGHTQFFATDLKYMRDVAGRVQSAHVFTVPTPSPYRD